MAIDIYCDAWRRWPRAGRRGLLTADEIAVLLHSERWSLVPEQATPVDDERHVSWLADNAHAHAHPEILVVVAGVGLHAHGDRVYACAPGTVFCFAPFDRHDAAPAPHLPDSRQLWFGLHGNRATARLLDICDGRWRRRWGMCWRNVRMRSAVATGP